MYQVSQLLYFSKKKISKEGYKNKNENGTESENTPLKIVLWTILLN